MSARAATGVAWVLVGLAATLVALALGFIPANGPLPGEAGSLVSLALGFPIVGALIARRHPRHPIAWVFLVAGMGAALALFAYGYAQYTLVTRPGALPGGTAVAWLSAWVWVLGLTPMVTFGLLLFPDGRLPSARWRPLAWLAAAAVALPALANALMPGPLVNHPVARNPLGIPHAQAILRSAAQLGLACFVVAALGSVASVLVRYRRSRGEQRQQLKWLAYAVVVLLVANVLPWPGPLVTAIVLSATALLVPIAVGIAILRHRLYDIDLVINRSLVYGALSACVVGVYVAVVGLFGSLIGERMRLAASLVATGLVAVGFAPLRQRLQRTVNRLLYGQRDDPYAVVAALGHRLEATVAPEAVLPSVVEALAGALKLPYVAIELAGEDRPAASHGHLRGQPVRFPLVYQGEVVGQLTVGPRAPGEALAAADLQLLEDLAGQVGVAVHAVRLTADLQRSRQRLVSAREEERRRLRRDLHDGLGSALAGLALQVGTARAVLGSDPTGADAQLARLECGIQALLVDIRRLVYALRPPALDELGLVGALRQQAATFATAPDAPLQVQVDAADELPPLPAAVEVAAYRIATEAITNVSRHAHARTCTIRLVLDGNLQLEVRDDGAGLPTGYKTGIGLASMRERAAELGGSCTIQPGPAGGTRVLARFPLPAP
jgi:two-component system, NarL family, sensor kinase